MARVVVVAGFLSLSAGGCGFHPLYGPTASGQNLTDVMKQVQIAPIQSRTGQRLRNELIFGATGGGEALNAVYRLDIALREIGEKYARHERPARHPGRSSSSMQSFASFA